MARANPIILLMGTAPLAQVAGMVWGSNAPYPARVGGTALCIVLAIGCVGLAVALFFDGKKKQREAAERDRRNKELKKRAATGIGARPASAADRSSRDGS